MYLLRRIYDMMVALRRRRAVLPKAADIDMVRKVHEMKFLSRTKILLAAVIAVILMTSCAFASEIEKVHPYYPAAKMKKTVKTGGITIRSGERVIVVKKGGSASLVKYKGKKYKVKASSYRIDGWNTRSKKRYSNATAEHFVNSKGYSSKTNYLIWVSTYTQQLYIFRGQRRHWKLIGHKICGTGRFGRETVMGESTVTFKRPWVYFNQSIGQGGYYCLRIRGGFIHSWPYNISWAQAHNGRKLLWSREHYGKPVSGGCVRVTLSFAKWLYKTTPVDTKVVIY